MKESDNNYKNLVEKEDSKNSSALSIPKTFFLNGEVEKSSMHSIEIRFKTLIESKCDKPFDWYKDLQLDKSYASKIRRGLIIPPEWLRIRIAQYFKTDSSTIWKIPEIVTADKLKNENTKTTTE